MNIEAHAKINLSLDITGIRENGYHDVKMVMQALKLCDEIELEMLPQGQMELSVDDLRRNVNKPQPKVRASETAETTQNGQGEETGKTIPMDQDNLMFKAAMRMKEAYGISSGFRMHLVKRIPAAAGLAGGSADAAAVIRGIDKLCDLNRPVEELMALGAKLGADIPYCILGGTALAEGIGEVLTAIDHKISLYVLLIKPELGLSTPQVYGAYDQVVREGTQIIHPKVDKMVEAIRENDISGMYSFVGNVLEYAVLPSVPFIHEIKRDMLEFGAECTCMTGSGSTVFGLFRSRKDMLCAAEKFYKMPYLSTISDIITTEFM